jgi:hypothetical protein
MTNGWMDPPKLWAEGAMPTSARRHVNAGRLRRSKRYGKTRQELRSRHQLPAFRPKRDRRPQFVRITKEAGSSTAEPCRT